MGYNLPKPEKISAALIINQRTLIYYTILFYTNFNTAYRVGKTLDATRRTMQFICPAGIHDLTGLLAN